MSISQTPEIKSAEFIRGIAGTDPILRDKRPHVAFVGRSNVGKSSVLNRLTNRNALARESRKPGKTKRLNFYLINNSLYFVDLPGYGYAKISAQAAEKIRQHILWYLSDDEVHDRVRGVVLVVDGKAGLTDYDQDLLEIIAAEGHPLVVVINKCDKLNQSERHHAHENALAVMTKKGLSNAPLIEFSAKTGRGKNELLEIIFSVT